MVPMAAGGAAAAVALVALLAALAVCRRRTRVRARRRAMMQSSHGQLRVWVNGPMAKRCVPSPLARPSNLATHMRHVSIRGADGGEVLNQSAACPITTVSLAAWKRAAAAERDVTGERREGGEQAETCTSSSTSRRCTKR